MKKPDKPRRIRTIEGDMTEEESEQISEFIEYILNKRNNQEGKK